MKENIVTRKTNLLLWIMLLIILLLIPWKVASVYYLRLINIAGIFSISVIGLDFVIGMAGNISLAQAAFCGIGAYTSALLAITLGWPFWITLPIAVFVSTVFGFLLGIPTLKLKTHYLAMVTIGFNQILCLILMNWRSVTHGADGIVNIPPVKLFSLQLDTDHNFYYLMIIFLVLVMILSRRIKLSRLGRALEAIKEDELAAEATGVNTHIVRTLAFCISAFCGGLAGCLYAHLMQYISPDAFALNQSVVFLVMLFIGGANSVSGPVIGAFLLTFLPEWLRFLQGYYMAIYGLGLVIIVIFMPDGLIAIFRNIFYKSFSYKTHLRKVHYEK